MAKEERVNKAGVLMMGISERVGKNALLLCRCPNCGNEFTMWRSHFYRGSNACKCRYSYDKRLSSIWDNIKSRCYNPKATSARYYYGKGITMCEEWKSNYKSFESWSLANGYSAGLTIDRIDNSKGYSPDNCRWVTPKEQNSNKSDNIIVTMNGESMTLAECCRKYGLSYKGATCYYYKHGRNPSVVEEYVKKKLAGKI